jgi:hypothetical protein
VNGASAHMARFCPWSSFPPLLATLSSPVIIRLPCPTRKASVPRKTGIPNQVISMSLRNSRPGA